MWPFAKPAQADDNRTVYDFTFHALMGDADMPLSQFRGKVILVVNTASKCGFTGQYDGLEKLYKNLSNKGLVIVGVPSDNFGHQEPGTNKDIAEFCQLNYGVSFPMAAKENVIGDDAHPFYKWARDKLGFLGAPKWNFHKYLISRDGTLLDYFGSATTPDDKKLIKAINDALAAS
jgi:glutathione peroxidase